MPHKQYLENVKILQSLQLVITVGFVFMEPWCQHDWRSQNNNKEISLEFGTIIQFLDFGDMNKDKEIEMRAEEYRELANQYRHRYIHNMK